MTRVAREPRRSSQSRFSISARTRRSHSTLARPKHARARSTGVVIGFCIAYCTARLTISYYKKNGTKAAYPLLPRHAAICGINQFTGIQSSQYSMYQAAEVVLRTPERGSKEFIVESMRFDDACAMLRYYRWSK